MQDRDQSLPKKRRTSTELKVQFQPPSKKRKISKERLLTNKEKIYLDEIIKNIEPSEKFYTPLKEMERVFGFYPNTLKLRIEANIKYIRAKNLAVFDNIALDKKNFLIIKNLIKEEYYFTILALFFKTRPGRRYDKDEVRLALEEDDAFLKKKRKLNLLSQPLPLTNQSVFKKTPEEVRFQWQEFLNKEFPLPDENSQEDNDFYFPYSFIIK